MAWDPYTPSYDPAGVFGAQSQGYDPAGVFGGGMPTLDGGTYDPLHPGETEEERKRREFQEKWGGVKTPTTAMALSQRRPPGLYTYGDQNSGPAFSPTGPYTSDVPDEPAPPTGIDAVMPPWMNDHPANTYTSMPTAPPQALPEPQPSQFSQPHGLGGPVEPMGGAELPMPPYDYPSVNGEQVGGIWDMVSGSTFTPPELTPEQYGRGDYTDAGIIQFSHPFSGYDDSFVGPPATEWEKPILLTEPTKGADERKAKSYEAMRQSEENDSQLAEDQRRASMQGQASNLLLRSSGELNDALREIKDTSQRMQTASGFQEERKWKSANEAAIARYGSILESHRQDAAAASALFSGAANMGNNNDRMGLERERTNRALAVEAAKTGRNEANIDERKARAADTRSWREADAALRKEMASARDATTRAGIANRAISDNGAFGTTAIMMARAMAGGAGTPEEKKKAQDEVVMMEKRRSELMDVAGSVAQPRGATGSSTGGVASSEDDAELAKAKTLLSRGVPLRDIALAYEAQTGKKLPANFGR